ncbi:MAG: hypothetical protein IPH07_28390 [Deltaproteobacteria bacterium]|jgi:hypothetical protein|nr:hypothetical protein [Deltaproteobacteria bacterium]MBK8714819.1 hypothetical protein [Deltaproteobacteria bacterium]
MEPIFTQMQQFSADLSRIVHDTVARCQTLAEQAQQGVGNPAKQTERLEAAVDEGARWAKASLAIGQELAQGYTRMALAAWRRATAWDLAAGFHAHEPS